MADCLILTPLAIQLQLVLHCVLYNHRGTDRNEETRTQCVNGTGEAEYQLSPCTPVLTVCQCSAGDAEMKETQSLPLPLSLAGENKYVNHSLSLLLYKRESL